MWKAAQRSASLHARKTYPRQDVTKQNAFMSQQVATQLT